MASTEILTHGDSKWTDVGPLPLALYGLRGVSINNKIIMTGNFHLLLNQLKKCDTFFLTGGEDTDYEPHDTIYSFDVTNHVWNKIGRMQMKRGGHDLSVVNTKDVIDYCID